MYSYSIVHVVVSICSSILRQVVEHTDERMLAGLAERSQSPTKAVHKSKVAEMVEMPPLTTVMHHQA